MKDDIEELLVDFYNGAHALDLVVASSHTLASLDAIVDLLASFESAYERLIALHVAGKVGAGAADLSNENLERVKRIRGMLESVLENHGAIQLAEEIRDLAKDCQQALSRK